MHAQRRELEYGLSRPPEPERNAIFRVDFDDPRIEWRLADGEAEIAPGVTAVSDATGTRLGTRASWSSWTQSVGGGGFVFAFDAADLTENIEDELPIGSFIGVSAQDTLEPIRRLKALAAEKGLRLVPGHDPVVWPALTDELAQRFGVGDA